MMQMTRIYFILIRVICVIRVKTYLFSFSICS